MRAEFRVLGPLEVHVDGRAVPIPAGRARVLLATLLLRANHFVSVDDLIDRLWDGAPPNPDRAKTTLQMVVTRLRQALGEANCVRTMTGGYRAEVTPDQLDLTRFRTKAGRGDLVGALDLWLGPVLANVASESLHRDDVPPLLEERLVVLERRLEADLDGGAGGALVPELRSLTQQYPLRERFWGQLMLALYRSGQQADALTAYRQISQHLADELGVDPGPELGELHRRMLRADAGLMAVAKPSPAEKPTPRQLPPVISTFAGRADDLRRLDRSTAQVMVISGTAGVGKTALAVHWAHRVRDEFPDGQIFLNLRGHDPHRAMTVAEAVSGVLRGLGVPASGVPADPDDQVSMYRSLVSDRAVLLVLDNAVGPEHVRPLVPTSPASKLVVTSRNELRGLLVLNDAELVRLTTLDEQDAISVLERILGPPRVAAEPDAVRQLIALCSGLPLALRIAAADLAAHPDTTIAAKVDVLGAGDRLAELAVPGDPDAAVGVVFAECYAALTTEVRTVFRALGLLPGADFTPEDAAVVAGNPVERTRRVLDQLVGAHLVEPAGEGRYTLHDLLRLYALDRCVAEESDGARSAAVGRMHDWYLRMVGAAADVLYADQRRLPVTPASVQLPERVLSGPDDAFSWLQAEHANVLAVIVAATGADEHRVASQLGSSLGSFYYHVRDSTHYSLMCHAWLRAAKTWGDPTALAAAWLEVCTYHYCQGDYAKSEDAAAAAVEIAGTLGDRQWVATALSNLGVVLQTRSDPRHALEHFRSALTVNEEIGSLKGRLNVLLNMAAVSWDLGALHDARGQLAEAVELAERTESFAARAHGHMSLAAVNVELGRFDDAVRHYETYVAMQQLAGNDRLNPSAMAHMAWVMLRKGRPDDAYDLAFEALEAARVALGNLEESACWNALAQIASELGEHRDAIDRSLIDLRHSSDPVFVRGQVRSLLQLAESHRNLGEFDRARAHLDEARLLIDKNDHRLRDGQELMERARLNLAENLLDEALRCAQQAVETLRRTGQRFREAQSLTTLAQVSRALGDDVDALEYERQAAESFAACGVAGA